MAYDLKIWWLNILPQDPRRRFLPDQLTTHRAMREVFHQQFEPGSTHPNTRESSRVFDDLSRLLPSGILQPVIVTKGIRHQIVENTQLTKKVLAHGQDDSDTVLPRASQFGYGDREIAQGQCIAIVLKHLFELVQNQKSLSRVARQGVSDLIEHILQ